MKYTAAFLQNSTELLYCYLIPREHLTFQNETFPRHKKFFWLHNITPKQPTAYQQSRARTQHCWSLKMETDFGETKKVSKDLHTASNMQSCTLFKVSSEKNQTQFFTGTRNCTAQF